MSDSQHFQVRVILTTTGNNNLDIGRVLPINRGKVWTVWLSDWAFFSTDYVISGYNNTFVVTYNGTPYTIVIPIGNYTISTLVAQLQTSINTALGISTFTVVAGSANGYITFTGVLTFSLTLGLLVSKLFGFNAGTTSVATSQTSICLPIVTNSPWYGLKIGRTYYNGFDQNGMSFVIPNTVSATGAVNRTTKSTDACCFLQANNESILTISFVDCNSNPVPLTNQQALFVLDFIEVDQY